MAKNSSCSINSGKKKKHFETLAKLPSAAHFCVVRCYALNCIRIRGFCKGLILLEKYGMFNGLPHQCFSDGRLQGYCRRPSEKPFKTGFVFLFLMFKPALNGFGVLRRGFFVAEMVVKHHGNIADKESAFGRYR